MMLKRAALSIVFCAGLFPLVAGAAVIPVCAGGGQVGGPYDLAGGDTFHCALTFSGEEAFTNGVIVLDFQSSAVPLTAEATVEVIGGSGSTWTSAKLEWFDEPANISLGSTGLTTINAGTDDQGFGGLLETLFSGPGTPDEQYVVLFWTGFDGGDSNPDDVLDINIWIAKKQAAVPLPGTLALLVLGLTGLARARRIQRS